MARYALVIGIGENQPPLGSIAQAERDARAIAHLLETHGGFRVTLVVGRVSADQLTEAVETFLRQAQKAESLVFYSGHGVPIAGRLGKSQVYLAPSDCELEERQGRLVGQRNGLLLSEVNEVLVGAAFSNLVMLLDCCHSGFLVEKELLRSMFGAFDGKDYVALTACRGSEQAFAEQGAEFSVFTGVVLAGLAQERADDQGVVSADRLIAFVKEGLRQGPQEPVSLGVGREVAIVTYRSATVPEKLDESIRPYQGLRAFTPETRAFFFGREEQSTVLLRQVERSPFVPVIGVSGSGKSSLVRAGLIPRLQELGWQILGPIQPGSRPMNPLMGVFEKVFARDDMEDIYQLLESEGLASVAKRLPEKQSFVLIIDQFEEIFTLVAKASERKSFAQCLLKLAEVESRLRLVITMRADFVDEWMTLGELIETIQNDAIFIGSLTDPGAKEDLVRAIVNPAQKLGYSLDEGLLDLILEDVSGEENCLPLLEFALERLWEKRDQVKKRLTISAYRSQGRLMGSLDIHAETMYRSLKPDEQLWTKRIFLELVWTGPETRDTRQRQSREALLNLAEGEIEKLLLERVIRRLETSRLVVIDEIGQMDLAHERLMDGWKRFADWRIEKRDLRRLAQRVKDMEKDWIEKHRKDDYLIHGGLLLEVNQQWDDLSLYLSKNVQDFCRTSDEFFRKNQQAKVEQKDSVEKLEQTLFGWSMVGRITNSLRDTLDEKEVLQKAVQALALAMGVGACNAALYDLERQTSTICFEYVTTLPGSQGRVAKMHDYPEIYKQLLQSQYFQFCSITPSPERGPVAMLACPIFDNEGVLGDLWLVNQSEYAFGEWEIRLTQQAANQCAIALRQAKLYQATQAQVAELEKINRVKDAFLSNISHELRTPMTNMKMGILMLDVALKQRHKILEETVPNFQTALDIKVEHYLEILRKECERESQLINDLLDLQRLESGTHHMELRMITLKDWLPSLVTLFKERARDRKQDLQWSVESGLPTITTNVQGLERILAELLNNACKYTPSGERISILARRDQDNLHLTVENSGVEIAPGELSKVFDKFYRVPNQDPWKQGGTGLGLALCRKLSQSMGGDITVNSGEGKTWFTLTLPLQFGDRAFPV